MPPPSFWLFFDVPNFICRTGEQNINGLEPDITAEAVFYCNIIDEAEPWLFAPARIMTITSPERDALKRAVLDTFVPQNTESSISDILDELDGEEDSGLLNVKQRNLLFFGRSPNIPPNFIFDHTHSWCDR